MGGRRAADLTHLVGKSRTTAPAKRNLTRAVSGQDPEKIVDATANLFASSSVGLKALRYGLKLTPYIRDHRKELSKLPATERSEAIRAAWSALKRKERIKAHPELDAAVVSAASSAFRKKT